MSYQQYRPQGFLVLPPVVKNLLILKGIMYLATIALDTRGIYLVKYLGLHYFASPDFNPYQFVTYLFMHGSFMHILSNMFALWMFGNILENTWGSKRFLQFYMITGIGAALVHVAVIFGRLQFLEAALTPEQIQHVYSQGHEALLQSKNYVNEQMATMNKLINTPTIGASGAVFGILLGFGMLYPNMTLYLYFAFPIKAKYFVIGYGLLELIYGVRNLPDDHIARFAHLGGMLFGFIMIKYWKRKGVY